MTEIPAGYKLTEVGVIPEDWEVSRLDRLTTKVGSGITPTGGSKVYKPYGRPFVRSQNVGWGTLLLDDLAFIDNETHSTFSDTEIHLDDVFLNITGASIGRSAVANLRVVSGNVNQHVCIIRTVSGLYPRFLNYFLLSDMGQRQIDSFQAGGNRQGLNFGQIRSIQLPYPRNPDEQRAIADALSEVDDQIAALDAAIAKKRDLKQGAMQRLLTGEERLPGFSGEWEKVKIEKLCKTFTKQTGFDYSASIKPSLITTYESNYIPFIQNKDFRGKRINFRTDYFVPYNLAKSFPEIILDERCLLISRYTCKTRWINRDHLDRQENRSKLNALQREEAFNGDAVRFGNQFVFGAGVCVATAQETHPVAQDQGEGAMESTSPKAPSTPQDP